MIFHKGTKRSNEGTELPSTRKPARPWYIAGGFVTVVAGLTVAGGVAAADIWGNGANMASQVISDGGQGGEQADRPGKDDLKDAKDDKGNGHRKDAVSCDANELIAAILLANNHSGGTLELAENCTYVLTANQDGNGLPTITEKITLRGYNTTIERSANGDNFRIFTVAAGGDLELCDLTIKGGRTTSSQGGGGVLVQPGGELGVEGSTFVFNQAVIDGGGAISNRGVTSVKQSTFANNSATIGGGAIGNFNSQLTVEESELTRNSATVGGGIFSDGVITLKKVDVSENTAGSGGGLFIDGSGTIVKSEISDNHAVTDGGGLFIVPGASVIIRDSKVTGNTSIVTGGGISNNGNLVVENSKINRNQAQLFGGGLFNRGIATLRKTDVDGNTAYGITGRGAGIYNTGGQVTLVGTEVSGNTATQAPGGLFSNNSGVTLNADSLVINNRPTNCQGSTVTIPGCFG